MEQKILQFGVEEENRYVMKCKSIKKIMPLDEKSSLGIGEGLLFIFNERKIIETYPIPISTGSYNKSAKLLIGITQGRTEFCFFSNNNFSKCYYTNTDSGDKCPHTIEFIEKFNMFIVVGEHLTLWSYKFKPSPPTVQYVPPTIELTKLKILIYDCKIRIINPPAINNDTGEIYAPSNDGYFMSYKYDDYTDTVIKKKIISLHDNDGFSFAFRKETGDFLTTDTNNFLNLSTYSGIPIFKVCIGCTRIIAASFINDEFAVVLDANNDILIVDYKTGFYLNCYTSSFQVTRIFANKDKIFVAVRNELILLDVITPWKLWLTTSISPKSIIRVPRFRSAARILIQCGDSQFRMVSPINGYVINAVTLKSTKQLSELFYDRGIGSFTHDQIFVLYKNGVVPIYGTGKIPCVIEAQVKIRITTISIFMMDDKPIFAAGTNNGHFLLLDYSTLAIKKNQYVSYSSVLKLFYHEPTKNMIIVAEKEVILWDFNSGKVISSLPISYFPVLAFFVNKLFIASSKGTMTVIEVKDNKLKFHDSNGINFHTKRITAISISPSFMVTSSLDCTIKIWSTMVTLVYTIEFPIPILCCCFRNGTRDILVGIESYIMIVDGEQIFEGEVDWEDKDIDNFDRIHDELIEDVVVPLAKDDDNKGSLLLSKEFQKPKKKKKKFHIDCSFNYDLVSIMKSPSTDLAEIKPMSPTSRNDTILIENIEENKAVEENKEKKEEEKAEEKKETEEIEEEEDEYEYYDDEEESYFNEGDSDKEENNENDVETNKNEFYEEEENKETNRYEEEKMKKEEEILKEYAFQSIKEKRKEESIKEEIFVDNHKKEEEKIEDINIKEELPLPDIYKEEEKKPVKEVIKKEIPKKASKTENKNEKEQIVKKRVESIKPKKEESKIKPKKEETNVKPKKEENKIKPKKEESKIKPKKEENNIKPKKEENNIKPKKENDKIEPTKVYIPKEIPKSPRLQKKLPPKIKPKEETPKKEKKKQEVIERKVVKRTDNKTKSKRNLNSPKTDYKPKPERKEKVNLIKEKPTLIREKKPKEPIKSEKHTLLLPHEPKKNNKTRDVVKTPRKINYPKPKIPKTEKKIEKPKNDKKDESTQMVLTPKKPKIERKRLYTPPPSYKKALKEPKVVPRERKRVSTPPPQKRVLYPMYDEGVPAKVRYDLNQIAVQVMLGDNTYYPAFFYTDKEKPVVSTNFIKEVPPQPILRHTNNTENFNTEENTERMPMRKCDSQDLYEMMKEREMAKTMSARIAKSCRTPRRKKSIFSKVLPFNLQKQGTQTASKDKMKSPFANRRFTQFLEEKMGSRKDEDRSFYVLRGRQINKENLPKLL